MASCAAGRTDITNFLGQVFTVQCNGSYYGYTIKQLAQWVPYQSYLAPIYGILPISLIICQWGIESAWGGPNISSYYNPGEQGAACGYSQCGTQPNGFPKFCSISAGVKAYSALIINGYSHVMRSYTVGGAGQAGMQAAATALGQGYASDNATVSNSFCGGPSQISPSTPRLWDQGRYTSVNQPGSKLYNTINDNPCLSELNYAQAANPGVSLC